MSKFPMFIFPRAGPGPDNTGLEDGEQNGQPDRGEERAVGQPVVRILSSSTRISRVISMPPW
jgi:hypothetical protein